MALATTYHRSAEVTASLCTIALGLSENGGEPTAECSRTESNHGLTRLRVVLYAEASVEEAQVLRHFGDRGDGGFSRAVGHTLLDSHGWGYAD